VNQPTVPVIITLSFLFLTALFDRQSAQADCRSYADVITHGAYGVADSSGNILSSCNPDKQFIPASIVKIATALVALRVLGRDFHFTTEWYLDSDNNLYARGTGDPFLVSEEIDRMAEELRNLGVLSVNSIFIDNSMYSLSGYGPGRGTSDNPYDAPVAAVGVNFNTVSIIVGKNGQVASAEPQTPDLPIMVDTGRALPPGEYRLNVCQQGCRPEEQSARYAAELFRALLTARGTTVGSGYGIRTVPAEARLVYRHQNTRNLEEVVFSFLKYSNNYVANQVYLACGAGRYGYPATWAKADSAFREALTAIVGEKTASMLVSEDGAGLSRSNRVSARAMLEVLRAFKPYSRLLQEKKDAALKSGTLDGVYNYAGYLPGGRPFVILLNQERNTRDRILLRLEKEVQKKQKHEDR